MTIDLPSISNSNRIFIDEGKLLRKKAKKINKKIEILNELKLRLSSFGEEVSAIDEFARQNKFDFQKSLNHNLTIAYSSKESFFALKTILFNRAGFIDITLELEKSRSRSTEEIAKLNFLQRKVRRWFSENQNDKSSNKRKRNDEEEGRIDFENSSLQPPTKKAEREELDGEKEKGVETVSAETGDLIVISEEVVKEKGKEKVIDHVPHENLRVAEEVKYYTISEELVVQIGFRGEIPKIIMGNQNDLTMILGERMIHTLSSGGSHYYKSREEITDIAAAGNFGVANTGKNILIFEKSATSSVLFDKSTCLGSIDAALDLSLKSKVMKVELCNQWLYVGTKSSEILGIFLPMWKEWVKQVKQSGAQHKERKSFFREGKHPAIYRIPQHFSSVAPNGISHEEEGNPSGKRDINSLVVNSEYIVAGTSAGLTARIDLRNSGKAFRYGALNGVVDAVGMSIDGSLLFSGSRSGIFNVWDRATNFLIHQEEITERSITGGMMSLMIIQIESVSTGAFILTTSSESNRKNLYHYDAKTKKLEKVTHFVATAVRIKEENEKCIIFYTTFNNELYSITLQRMSFQEFVESRHKRIA